MVELVIALAFFILGCAAGAGCVLWYSVYQISKLSAQSTSRTALMEELKSKAAEIDKVKDSIKERLIAASNLAKMQMELRAKVETPSMNALHSRYKMEVMGEIKELELEKLRLLTSIISDGYDPSIIVLNEKSAETKIPLSEYISNAQATLKEHGIVDTNLPQDKQPKQIGKFVIYKGGKDDGTTH